MRERHFETLDGLRGIAAVAVFAFHMTELIFPPEINLLRHAALAVDFFFCLSGYVIGHAYDARRSLGAPPDERLTLKAFALKRLIRLHPMVVFGVLWGLIAFLCCPFAPDGLNLHAVGAGLMTENVVLGLLLLPSPSFLWGLTHSLNAPAWSLAQEYLANIFYAPFGHRVGKLVLGGVVAVSGGALLAMALRNDTIVIGPDWGTVWAGPIRVATSFTLGLLLCRLGIRWRLPYAFPVLTLVLIAIMISPTLRGRNGLVEWSIAMIAFPAIVIAGAGQTAVAGRWGVFCRLSGRLSYPLYMVHYPFALYFAFWHNSRNPSQTTLWFGFSGALIAGLIFAYLVMRLFDTPIRSYLSRVVAKRNDSRVRDHGTDDVRAIQTI
jgi:peptidoglycan/LPS O-acetylase OafA/YrhL